MDNFDSLNDTQLLVSTIEAYKNYIDRDINLTEEVRSELLMIARRYDLEAGKRGIY